MSFFSGLCMHSRRSDAKQNPLERTLELSQPICVPIVRQTGWNLVLQAVILTGPLMSTITCQIIGVSSYKTNGANRLHSICVQLLLA